MIYFKNEGPLFLFIILSQFITLFKCPNIKYIPLREYVNKYFLLEEICYNDKKCRPPTGLDKHQFIGKDWYQRKFCQSYSIRHC